MEFIIEEDGNVLCKHNDDNIDTDKVLQNIISFRQNNITSFRQEKISNILNCDLKNIKCKDGKYYYQKIEVTLNDPQDQQPSYTVFFQDRNKKIIIEEGYPKTFLADKIKKGKRIVYYPDGERKMLELDGRFKDGKITKGIVTIYQKNVERKNIEWEV